MNFFSEAGYTRAATDLAANYNADDLLKLLPGKLNNDLADADYMTKSAAVNLINIIGIPAAVMFIILVSKCIPLTVKILVVFLVVMHIVIGTVFIVSTEQLKKKLPDETTMQAFKNSAQKMLTSAG